ncbi:uncharacterized protein [Apostichopus japonicus]|uniref:uncharacterized protein n=1 Tax=Stichopus japonicus TaxID=307972 RepID=UPI003AB1F526
MSVMTDSEGEGLLDMATGLMQRYRLANEMPPPKLLYVDRGCCLCTGNYSKLKEMFHEWSDLFIRLDIWHFLRRFSLGCTSQSHALYPAFMSQLSACIFEWDAADLAQLRLAKEAELGASGVWSLEKQNVALHITKKELQLHCRRRTRGTEDTTRLIKEVIDVFSSERGKDTMGIPLLHPDSIQMIWDEQQRHVQCIQDPEDPSIQLYTQTGSLVKGGQRLPVYRCARGSTSLESFHLHINRFIPGTTANAMHFQAYLLEGIVRWNEDRAFSALQSSGARTHCYNSELRHEVNRVNKIVYGTTFDQIYQDPARYTGEKIGIEYLYSQTGKNWKSARLDPDEPEDLTDVLDDEGFEEQPGEDDPTIYSPFNSQQQEPPGTSHEHTSSSLKGEEYLFIYLLQGIHYNQLLE